MTRLRSQTCAEPRTHARQRPQVTIGDTTTVSPTDHSSTVAPTAVTRPAISWPSVTGVAPRPPP